MLVQRVDLGDVHVQRLDHRGLLFSGCGDRLVDVVDLANALRHAAQPRAGEVGDADAFLAVLLALGHGCHRLTRTDLQCFNHLLNLCRRSLGASGQAAHFVGDHGKAAARLPRPRRLDGGVEGEEVGLLGDAFDHFEDLPDVHGFAVQRFDVDARRADFAGQFVHHRNRALDHLTPVFGLLARGRGLLRGIGGVVRNFLGGGAQFVDRGGNAVGAGRLFIEIAQRCVGRQQHTLGAFVDAERRRRHLANGIVDTFDKAVERRRQLADFIP
ncbi:hypothetical protein D3C84_660100 [compost metagenome]